MSNEGQNLTSSDENFLKNAYTHTHTHVIIYKCHEAQKQKLEYISELKINISNVFLK